MPETKIFRVARMDIILLLFWEIEHCLQMENRMSKQQFSKQVLLPLPAEKCC